MLLFELEQQIKPLGRNEKFELIRYLLDLIATDELHSRPITPPYSDNSGDMFSDRSTTSVSEAWQTMLASEAMLRRDWERPEEDLAWAHL